jgi:hypothetical protein
MRGKNLKLDTAAVLRRAGSVIGTGIYSLEPGFNGGSNPEAPSPYSVLEGTADCVGVGLWIQGIDRFQPGILEYGGWVNTNSVWLMPALFVNLGQDFSKLRAGDALVYRSYKGLLGKRRYGHWMTVLKIPNGAKQLSDLTVVHCAQRREPATRATPGFAKGLPQHWAFFRPTHRAAA